MTPGLVVYGLGTFGRGIVDDLLAADRQVDLILDRGKRGQTYRGIPVQSLDDVSDGGLTGRTVLVGLHNHYVDIGQIRADLLTAGVGRILTPINLAELVPDALGQPCYWLDPSFDYSDHGADFARARSLLGDRVSRALFDAVVAYRRTGDIAECPVPSLEDEYTPGDLPRLPDPLRVVDGGAFTGVAIHKFLKAGYSIESVFAFEPDPANFAALAARTFKAARSCCLPLGLWSTTRQLRFACGASMASHLSEGGGTVVQCVAVDDILHGERVNVVKLDVEGAEIEALKGMRGIVSQQRPALLVSAYHQPGHLYEIVDLIASWDLDYRFHLRVHEFNTFGTVVYAFPE